MYVDVCTGEVEVDGVVTPWTVQMNNEEDTFEFFCPGCRRIISPGTTLNSLTKNVYYGLMALGAIRPSSKG